jgi:hypothetical protein
MGRPPSLSPRRNRKRQSGGARRARRLMNSPAATTSDGPRFRDSQPKLLNMEWPADLTVYKLLTDWGSFIGGGLALIAGVLAYIGARQAAAKQIAALSRKDRLQARSLAVAIQPELLQLKVRHERAMKIISEEFPKQKAPQHLRRKSCHSY